MKSIPASRNLWPYAIVAWFICFASGLVVFVVFTTKERIELVRPDYYEHEIHYQQQVNRLLRSAELRGRVTIEFQPATAEVIVRLPAGQVNGALVGKIRFYRPSRASLDFDVPLKINHLGIQRIAGNHLRPGLWKVLLEWTAGTSEYFFEQPIVVAESSAQTAHARTLPSAGEN